MSIISNEDEFVYNLQVDVKDNKYYKVSLINTISNHEQIILKNDDGVYVVTPDVNRSFKFTSNWPNNSSQIYLLESLVKDVISDTNVKFNNNIIEAKVNYPNNAKLVSESIYIDDNYNVKKVEVKDEDNKVMLKMEVDKIDYKPSFGDDYFKLNESVQEETTEKKKKEDCVESENNTCDVSNILEDIIYPLYVPGDTYLTSKDTIDTDEGNRIILTFAGVSPFILVEETSSINEEMEIIPVNGEPLLMGGGLALLSDNSLYWSVNGVDFYLTSKTLNGSEMMMIAESIQNSTSLVASTK